LGFLAPLCSPAALDAATPPATLVLPVPLSAIHYCSPVSEQLNESSRKKVATSSV